MINYGIMKHVPHKSPIRAFISEKTRTAFYRNRSVIKHTKQHRYQEAPIKNIRQPFLRIYFKHFAGSKECIHHRRIVA